MGLSFLLAISVHHKRMKRMSRRRRRQREIQNSNTWVAPEIPVDLLIQIMARLPAKSVMRFKCISKYLSSLLCSRYFCNLFLRVPSQLQPQPRIYMTLLDDISYSKSVLLSSAPSTCLSSVVFDQDLTLRRMGGYSLRSVRGFMCYTICLEARIYNPSIRQLVKLPFIKSSNIDPHYVLHFLCHDPVNNQYKILCVIMSKDIQMFKSELWVFVLEAGGSWKRVAKDFHPHRPTSLEVTMNGVLYYLAWTDSHTFVLVSFDIMSEEFNMIQVPRKVGDVLIILKVRAILINYGGKVAVFDYTYVRRNNGKLDIWVMEDWRKKEWSMKTLALQPSQVHFITRNNWRPKVISLKDNVMWIPQKLTSPFYYFYHDLRINDLKKVEVKGIPARYFSKPERTRYFDIEFMDSGENIFEFKQ
ncbi:F-box only protein 8 [Cardamine amara subsp. amara]|uniref:F-box only protein 8 n=1 Tax=Cardamine amara subsp. amara TaxID=228776 RepID=A0ABD1B1F8_CARAN